MAFLVDNFTDTDGVNLTAHTPDQGGAWTVQGGSAGALDIQANRARCTTSTIMVNAATPTSADYDVVGQLTVLSAIGTTTGIVGRALSNTLTAYGAAYNQSGGNFNMVLYQWITGGFTVLNAGTALPSQPIVGSTHEIRLRMVGTQVSVYYDGALLIAPVTGGITAAGLAGLWVSTAYTPTTGIHYDSLIADPPPVLVPAPLMRIPNRHVGPMALRQQFRRAQPTNTATLVEVIAPTTQGNFFPLMF